MRQPIRVLFLCEGNADRSQMAEGLLRAQGDQRFEVHSAGIDPRPLDPLAIAAMQEIGIDIAGQPSKHLNDYEEMQFDYVVTLCERVVGSCLDFARDGHSLRWYCIDPSDSPGSDADRLAAFRQAREEIQGHLDAWMKTLPV
ncbi:MAG TPA: arsenate reductase ArsC [Pseudomonas sp.]